MATLVLILLILAGVAAIAVLLGFTGRFGAVRLLAAAVALLVAIEILGRI